jgi:hypothetical protein
VRSIRMHCRRLLCGLTAIVLSVGCSEVERQEQPHVLASADDAPRWTVDLHRILDGVFRNYRPRCMDTVRVGHTVEFRNFNPDVPANVTSLDAPAGATPLYSPNLVVPYNYVGRDDPRNDLCEASTASGECERAPHWSYWRYTFQIPGTYDWFDTNSGEPGRKIVDAYYGTVTFVGIDPSTPFGTICVQNATGGGCEGVCCVDDSDCSAGQRCFRSEVDAIGRCLSPSG